MLAKLGPSSDHVLSYRGAASAAPTYPVLYWLGTAVEGPALCICSTIVGESDDPARPDGGGRRRPRPATAGCGVLCPDCGGHPVARPPCAVGRSVTSRLARRRGRRLPTQLPPLGCVVGDPELGPHKQRKVACSAVVSCVVSPKLENGGVLKPSGACIFK